MAEPRRFEIVNDDPPHAASPQESQSAQVAQKLILMALQTLSQKAMVAIDGLFTLFTVCLVFWYAMSILPDPGDKQLMGLALFALFVLAANVIHFRRKK